MDFKTQIRLFGNDYLLIGSLEDGGPIATKEAYEKFECSYAYLMPDGKIMRFHEQIGSRDDIEVLKEKVEVSPNPAPENIFLALLSPEDWVAGQHSTPGPADSGWRCPPPCDHPHGRYVITCQKCGYRRYR